MHLKIFIFIDSGGNVMTKRLLSILPAMAMVIGAMPTASFAEGSVSGRKQQLQVSWSL